MVVVAWTCMLLERCDAETRICLNMIAKDEVDDIVPALESFKSELAGWTVCDTGANRKDAQAVYAWAHCKLLIMMLLVSPLTAQCTDARLRVSVISRSCQHTAHASTPTAWMQQGRRTAHRNSSLTSSVNPVYLVLWCIRRGGTLVPTATCAWRSGQSRSGDRQRQPNSVCQGVQVHT